MFRRNEQLTLKDTEPKSGFRHEYPFKQLIGPRTILVTQATPAAPITSLRTGWPPLST